MIEKSSKTHKTGVIEAIREVFEGSAYMACLQNKLCGGTLRPIQNRP